MLTDDDIKKIRKVIRQEVEVETKSTRDKLGNDITVANMRLRKDLSELGKKTKKIEISVKDAAKNIKNIQTNMRKINKTLKVAIDFFDRGNIKLENRVIRIEDHLNLPPNN